MKICFVSPYSPKAVTGVGTFITELSKGLEQRGHKSVTITALQVTYNKEKPKIDLIEVDCRKIRKLKDFYLSIKTALLLLKLRREIDIIHCQVPHLQSYFSTIAGKIIGKAVMTTLHGKLPRPDHPARSKALSIYEKFMPYLSDAVVFVSKVTMQEFGSLKGNVIYNGIDTKIYFPDDKERIKIRDKLKLTDKFVILFTSRWAENKGIFELLEAFSRALHLAPRKMKLVLIGGGDALITKRVLERIRSLNLEDHVLPIGEVDDVLNYLRMADLFVLPSYFEGLPIGLLEAMACGLPVIASNVGGNVEVIEDGINGLFVESKNIDDLTIKIVRILKHEDELREMSRNARRTVEKRFSLPLMAEKYIGTYKRLVG